MQGQLKQIAHVLVSAAQYRIKVCSEVQFRLYPGYEGLHPLEEFGVVQNYAAGYQYQ